jgi:hypothetical protein
MLRDVIFDTMWFDMIIGIISFDSVLLVSATESAIKQTINIKYV